MSVIPFEMRTTEPVRAIAGNNHAVSGRAFPVAARTMNAINAITDKTAPKTPTFPESFRTFGL